MKYLPLLFFIISIFSACSERQPTSANATPVPVLKSEAANVIPQDSPTKIPPNSLSQKSSEIKPLTNFFTLANKSISEIEKIYGKPSTIDTKSVQMKPGEYRIYDKLGARLLQVDYLDGKAVAFYLDIPDAMRTQSPEETLKLCGLNIRLSGAQTDQKGFWWDKLSTAKPFTYVRLSKFNDSGLFYNCEAHIKLL